MRFRFFCCLNLKYIYDNNKQCKTEIKFKKKKTLYNIKCIIKDIYYNTSEFFVLLYKIYRAGYKSLNTKCLNNVNREESL